MIQVVHCHPLADSYNHALFRVIVTSLERNGHQVIATDLYRDGFQPAMTEAERRSYMGPDYDGHAVAEYIAILRKIDGIIFCFPHWWYAMPAVLKGYVDRAWAPGTAFTYGAKHRDLQPNLQSVRLFGVVTSYGSPWWNVVMLAGDPGRKDDARSQTLMRQRCSLALPCSLRYGPLRYCFTSEVLGEGSRPSLTPLVSKTLRVSSWPRVPSQNE